MEKQKEKCNFIISEKFEYLSYKNSLFEFMGICIEETNFTGKIFLDILNNIDDIIDSLIESVKYKENVFEVTGFIENKLRNKLDLKLSSIIVKDLKNSYSFISNEKSKLKENIEYLEEATKKNKSKTIKEDLKELKEKYIEYNLSEKFEEYIKILINDLKKYKFYVDEFYNIDVKNDYVTDITNNLKKKNSIFFKAIFDFKLEIPHYIVYYGVENEKQKIIYPLKVFLKNKTKSEIECFESFIENKKIIYLNNYEITSLKDLLNVYFNYFIENKICIKKCENCGKYFIPLNRNDTIYCYNPSPQNPNKTCKEIGAKEKEKNKLTKIKKEHEKINQFFRNKRRLKDEKLKADYEQAYTNFKSNYNKKKKQYEKGNLREDEFIEWIKNQKGLNK